MITLDTNQIFVLFMALFIGVVIISIRVSSTVSDSVLKQKAKQLQTQDLLKQLGLGKFNIKDLNNLTEEGFKRLVVLVQYMQTTTAGGTGQIGKFMNDLKGMAEINKTMKNLDVGSLTNPGIKVTPRKEDETENPYKVPDKYIPPTEEKGDLKSQKKKV